MKFVGVVPARGGSKGIANKNLQTVGQYNLVQRSVLSACNSTKLDCLVVTSDSPRILESVNQLAPVSLRASFQTLDVNTRFAFRERNEKIPIYLHRRKAFLAQDSSLIIDTLYSLTDLLELVGIKDDFVFLLLQPTTPFRAVNEIDSFIDRANCFGFEEGMVSVKRVDDSHPARMYKIENDRLISLKIFEQHEFSPRQELPPVYLRDGGYYLITKDMLRARQNVSKNSFYFLRTFPFTLNIDSMEDLVLARALSQTPLNEEMS